MKKFFAVILVLCLCAGLLACGKPSDGECKEALNELVFKDAQKELAASDYYRVAIDTLEADGKNQWKAEGNVSYTNSSGITIAVLYTTTLHYNPKTEKFSTDTVFGETFRVLP